MPPKLHSLAAVILAANLVVLLADSRPAMAGDASEWDGTQRAAVRLIAGERRVGKGAAVDRAGIEIRLAQGWKTYWRYPGDAGIPPRFSFAGSRNVKSITVRYPAPHRLTDEGGTSIGYKHDVVFPLDILAEDAAKPITISLQIEYAVCEKICVPADGKAELTLSGKPGVHDGKLVQGEALVPRAVKLGDEGALSIRAARREGKRIEVDVAAPGSVELFAEGPQDDWALPVPAPIAGAPAGQQRFAFELDGLPPGISPEGATLRLTAVAGEQSIEAPYRLDSGN
jgi:DsbC/DsbD-like thiol-disulfide interchange protein